MIDRQIVNYFDWTLLIIVILISSLGLIALYSATQHMVATDITGFWSSLPQIWKSQFVWLCLGLLAMSVTIMIDYRYLEQNAWLIYAISVVLLVLVLVVGKVAAGSQRWLNLGVFNIQPSELMRVSLIIALAKYFHDDAGDVSYGVRGLIFPALIILLPAILIYKEPDLGGTLMLLMIAAPVFVFVGMRLKLIMFSSILGVIMIPISFFFLMSPYQKKRVLTFLNPQSDPLGDGYHILQSIITIGSGGLWGKGYLQGSQSQLAFIPKAETDFIFSVLAEEWGFLGGGVVLFLFLILFLLGMNIAFKAKDTFGSIVAVGVTFSLFWAMFVNVGMELGLLPVVGIALPFFSYGGSAMIVNMISVGLLLNISMRRFIF